MKKQLRFSIFLLLLVSGVSQAQINPTQNKIGLDISTPPQNGSFNYDSCLAIGKDLGMTQCGLALQWTTLETSPGSFNFILLDIANAYYPAKGIAIDLNINPINTNRLEVPSSLAAVAFDSSLFIGRFENLLDSVKHHLPNLTLSSLVIGSEIDVYLGSNAGLWTRYSHFYTAVSAYAKTLWPGLKVATELTMDGLINQNASAQLLNTASDYIGVSYYPLHADFTVKPVTTIPGDFSALINLYPGKPLCFYQYGYPSSATCSSSPAQQAQFITQTFLSWDLNAPHIHLIDFTWLHDLDTATIHYDATYYGLTDPVFLEYLHTLGLRDWYGNGTDKPALNELRCQARERGYNTLSLACAATGIPEVNSGDGFGFSAFPNPARSSLTVHIGTALLPADLELYNALGQLEKHIPVLDQTRVSLETGGLEKGLHLLILRNDKQLLSSKLLIEKE